MASQAQRCAGDDVLDPRIDGGVQRLVRHDLVDEAKLERLRGADAPAGEQDAHGRRSRNPAGQEHHAVQRQTADPGFGLAEGCALRGDDEVAAQHHLEPAPQRRAVHLGDHGDRQAAAHRDAAESVVAGADPVVDSLRPVLLHVRARAERAAGAGEDHAAYLRIPVDRVPDPAERRLRRGVDGVHAFRPVQRDPGDSVRNVELDAHSVCLRACRFTCNVSVFPPVPVVSVGRVSRRRNPTLNCDRAGTPWNEGRGIVSPMSDYAALIRPAACAASTYSAVSNLREHPLVVLPEPRRSVVHRERCRRHVDGRGDEPHRPPGGRVQLHDHPVAGGLRVVERVLQRLHRSAKDVDPAEPLQPVRRGVAGEAVAEDRPATPPGEPSAAPGWRTSHRRRGRRCRARCRCPATGSP